MKTYLKEQICALQRIIPGILCKDMQMRIVVNLLDNILKRAKRV